MLSTLGFTVLRARDGIVAMAVFRQHMDEIRLALIDVTMPCMNSWETMLSLRQIMPGIRLILVSGFSEELGMKGVHAENPQVFLGIPNGFKALTETIRRTLQKTNE